MIKSVELWESAIAQNNGTQHATTPSSASEAGDDETSTGPVTSTNNRFHPLQFLHHSDISENCKACFASQAVNLLLTSSFWHLFCRLWSASYSCRLPCWLQGVKEEETGNPARNKEKDRGCETCLISRVLVASFGALCWYTSWNNGYQVKVPGSR